MGKSKNFSNEDSYKYAKNNKSRDKRNKFSNEGDEDSFEFDSYDDDFDHQFKSRKKNF
jgi:hypothetical protein